jgi:hypothetical protein
MTKQPMYLPIAQRPPAIYLGDSLYADFPASHDAIRVWAATPTTQSQPLFFTPETLGQLLDYAAKCYALLEVANDE